MVVGSIAEGVGVFAEGVGVGIGGSGWPGGLIANQTPAGIITARMATATRSMAVILVTAFLEQGIVKLKPINPLLYGGVFNFFGYQ